MVRVLEEGTAGGGHCWLCCLVAVRDLAGTRSAEFTPIPPPMESGHLCGGSRNLRKGRGFRQGRSLQPGQPLLEILFRP